MDEKDSRHERRDDKEERTPPPFPPRRRGGRERDRDHAERERGDSRRPRERARGGNASPGNRRDGRREPPPPAPLSPEDLLKQKFGAHRLSELRKLLSRHLLSPTARIGASLYDKYVGFMGWTVDGGHSFPPQALADGVPFRGRHDLAGSGPPPPVERDQETIRAIGTCVDLLDSVRAPHD